MSNVARRAATDDRLRVLILTPKGFLGGAELWLLSLLRSTARLDPVVVVLDEGELLGELARTGIGCRALPCGPGAADIAAAAARVQGLIKEHDPDVILGNGVKAATVALLPARAAGVPLVWVRHEDSFAATLGRTLLRYADATISVSPPTEAESAAHRIEFIPPPLFSEPLPTAEAQAVLVGLGVPDDGLLKVGMLCRLAPYKGVDRMIEALAEPAGKDWRLVVAGIEDPGAPAELPRLQELAGRLGVSDRVDWLGQVPQAGRLAAGFDALAMPTRAGEPGWPNAEGFGLAAVEALAAGVPVIGDPRCVPPLAMREYRDGTIGVDATDPAALAAALGRLADDEQRAVLSAAARQAGAGHPRSAQVADRVVDVLAAAATRPGAGLADGPAMSVVTTVFNEGSGIDDLLSLLVPQLTAADELVVVDGGSSDDTVARLQAWRDRDPRVRVIVTGGAGISEGRNIGIRAAGNDWIACTDAGCEPLPGWLEGLRRAAACGDYELVTGLYAPTADGRAWQTALAAVGYPNPDDVHRWTAARRAHSLVFGLRFSAAAPTGRCVAFTKQAWHAAGGFPEDLATAEDVLFGKRAVEAGASATLTQDALVLWDQRPTLRSNLRMYYRYGQGGGQSGDPVLIGRDVARALAYVGGPLLLAGRRTRWLALAGAAAYYSVPVSRTLRSERPVAGTALVPVIAAARDISKALGTLDGLRGRRKGTA